jgi:hypothetical protein
MTHSPSTQTASPINYAAIIRMAIVIVAAALAGIMALPQNAAAATLTMSSSTLFNLKNPNIFESSGIVSSGGIYWTHNDGAVNKFYAINSLGKTLAIYSTPGVPTSKSDWEDMAEGKDPSGNPALFFGDIGDNAKARPEIAVIRVAKPRVDVTKFGVTATATGITRFRFVYPDGKKDAERLAVQPGTNRIFIVSKAAGGAVYAAPLNPSTTTVNKLTKVGVVTIPGATGAAFSPDGTKFVVRQYKNAAMYKVVNKDLTAAIKTVPASFYMPAQRQGEAITFSPTGKSVVLSSEGEYSPVLSQISPL